MALKHEDLTSKIIGTYYEVYNELGHGFVESVYHRAMLIALSQRGLLAESEVVLPVRFRGTNVGDFRADIVVEGSVLVGAESCPGTRKRTRGANDELLESHKHRDWIVDELWPTPSI